MENIKKALEDNITLSLLNIADFTPDELVKFYYNIHFELGNFEIEEFDEEEARTYVNKGIEDFIKSKTSGAKDE